MGAPRGRQPNRWMCTQKLHYKLFRMRMERWIYEVIVKSYDQTDLWLLRGGTSGSSAKGESRDVSCIRGMSLDLRSDVYNHQRQGVE